MEEGDKIQLTSNLQEIRSMINDKDISNKIQDKKFAELQEDMIQIAQAADFCRRMFIIAEMDYILERKKLAEQKAKHES